jgi:ketosteroid isomerase-like protein
MSSEDVKALDHAFEALHRGDLEAVASHLDPDFEVGNRIVPEGRLQDHGPEALAANIAQIREVFGDVSWRPREVIDLDGRLLVRVRLEATADHTALPFAEDIGHLYTLREGRVLRLDIYRNWEEARAAAGLVD